MSHQSVDLDDLMTQEMPLRVANEEAIQKEIRRVHSGQSEETVMETMRAAVYRGIDQVEVEQVPIPEIAPREVLVRVSVCGVCGTDLKKIHLGLTPPPRIFGHETAGTIASVGNVKSGCAKSNADVRSPVTRRRQSLMFGSRTPVQISRKRRMEV